VLLHHKCCDTILAVEVIAGVLLPGQVDARNSLTCIQYKLHAAMTLSLLPAMIYLKIVS